MSPHPWEEAIISGQERAFPTTLVLHSVKNASYQRNFMAVSYPGSNNVRCYDLDLGLRYDDFSIQNKIKPVSPCQGESILGTSIPVALYYYYARLFTLYLTNI